MIVDLHGWIVLPASAEREAELDARLPDRNSLRRAGPASKRAVVVAGEVLKLAVEARDRIGVYVAQQHGPMDECADFVAASHRGPPRFVSPAVFTEAVENIVATHLSLTWGLTGVVETYTGTRVAAIQALAAARDDLLAGETDAAVVVATGGANAVCIDAYRSVYRAHARPAPFGSGAAAVLLRRPGAPGVKARLAYADVCCFGRGRDARRRAMEILWRQAVSRDSAPDRVLASHFCLDDGAAEDLRRVVRTDVNASEGPDSFALHPVASLVADEARVPGALRRAVVCLSEEGTAGVLILERPDGRCSARTA